MKRLAAAFAFMALSTAGCERLGLAPPPAESAPEPVAPTVPDFSAYVGQTYSELATALPQYAPDALGLTEQEAARLHSAMVQSVPAWTVSGGGAEALVLTGCAAGGCDEGRGVVGIDLGSGAAFAGVSDADGSAELAQNDRVEVLLRLSAPSGRWDDAQPAEAPAETAAP